MLPRFRPLAPRLRTALFGVAAGLVATFGAHTGAVAGAAGGSDAARDAFTHGDVARAESLASAAHDSWVGGLAAFRLQNFTVAMQRFAAVADDRSKSDGARAAAGYWASRAAEKAGDASKGADYLKLAAAFPRTFYGLIAERRLALQGGMARATEGAASVLGALPRPELAPAGGFTIAKSLVYAIVLRESRFNAQARGGSAYGLMQLTPDTAARVTGDRHFASNPARLHDASVNLRVGQTYVAKLLSMVGGDLLRGLAAYNAGPGMLVRAPGTQGGDSLMALESLPGATTRDFVQKVMLNYWTYRRAFGATSSPSLDAAASGGKLVLASLDD